MKPRVVITGLGAVTAVGQDVPTFWDNIVAGRSGIDTLKSFDTTSLRAKIGAEITQFDPRAHFSAKQTRQLDRFVQLALVAAREALADAGLNDTSQLRRERVGTYIGSAFGGVATVHAQMAHLEGNGRRRVSPYLVPMMLQNMVAGQIAIEHQLKGPSLSPNSACAAASDAIGLAAELIWQGDAEVMVCGGSEAPITPLIMSGFDSLGVLSTSNDTPQQACRPFSASRNGCVIGEGAGIIILESLAHARRRNAPIYGELIGYGASTDATHITSPSANGEGIARAMCRALDKAAVHETAVHYINAHGTGTHKNDQSETAGMKSVFGPYAQKLAVSSTKPSTGHLMGASGAIEAIICTKALQTQVLPPTLNYDTLDRDPDCDLDYVPNEARIADLTVALSNSVGFGGHNATLAFRRWE